jgi:4-hydroxyphenylacetate 3-monooxygenase
MTRSGQDYIAGLRDDRAIFVDGQRVTDVADHPAFRHAIRSVARLYDIAASPEHRDVMTYPSPRTGRPVNKAFLLPRTRDDLTARRAAHKCWADASYGLMGRSPDFMASLLVGFALRPDVFARGGPQFADNVARYYARVRDEDLFVSHVMIPPQADRSKTSHEQVDPQLCAGVVAERSDGIVISGAQILGTASAISDEVFLSCIVPLRPGDENYAISLAVPIATPGLRLIVRRPYAEGQPSVFDYPLSTRFDETDAVLIFDQVFVPWERVFVYRNLGVTAAQFSETPAHLFSNHQAQLRFCSKAQFLAGLAHRIAEANGIEKQPRTQGLLGELASYVSMAESLVRSSESECLRDDERGFVYPNSRYVYANTWLQATYYGTMLDYLRELSSSGMLQVPSSHLDWAHPDIARDLNRYFRSPAMSPLDRVKLFKLAWDIVGSEFAGRHAQYELFYAGSRTTASLRAYKAFDFAAAKRLVEDCLAGYDLPGATQRG